MVQAKKSKKAKRVIPGFGLSLGVTITLLSLVVLIPLAALVIYTAQMSPSEFWEAITRERVLASYKVSFITAFIASSHQCRYGCNSCVGACSLQIPRQKNS